MDFDTLLRRKEKLNLYGGISCSPALRCFMTKPGSSSVKKRVAVKLSKLNKG